ncbi:restriction endonuclease subunit S [Endozoicomonas arenosclerae]|uniref:restriction endonuclease subunit S n=1 Tax=Endozoicomonas arenosclerae TaxID=1633495 RepID=UPI0009A162CC|nr:restriction endonuclease subunit S [Endozoicomonas arenosclerae]
MNWPLVKLSNLCEINIGKTPARKSPQYWGTGHPWLSIADMSQGKFISWTKEEITELGVKESGIKLVKQGTVLFSFKLSIGKVGIAQRDLYTNEAIAALPIKDSDELDPNYLIYALSQLDVLLKTDRAVMGATLNKKKLAELEIPFPPLPEQKRIAAILDKADQLRQKRQQAIGLADEFLRSVFLDMFGDPVTNPKGWEVKQVKDFAQVTTGNTPSRKIPEFYGKDVEWIKSDNINTPSHYLTCATEHLSSQGAEVGRIAKEGSVLITCIAGSPSCVGNAAIADRDVAFNQQINALTPVTGLAVTEFIYALALFGKKKIQEASTNAMKGMVSKGKLETVCFILPPLDSQLEFAKSFKRIHEFRLKFSDVAQQSDDLFNALSQKAFAGEL